MNSKQLLLSFSILTLSIFAGNAGASTSPVAFYAAEGNGTDGSGRSQHATVPITDASNPGLNYTAGKVGQAFNFTGLTNVGGSQTGTYVDFGHWFDYQSFTLAMWIRDDASDAAPQTNFAPIIGYSSNADFLWSLFYSAADNAYQWTNDGAGAINFSLTRGVWHYLVITRDGASGVTNIYVDNALVGTAGSVPWTLNYDFAANIRMGASANLSAYWHGAVDEFRIYDRAISADEIALLASNSAVDLVVPGTANPYLAGMPNGAAACGGDSAPNFSPAQVTGVNLTAGATLMFSAAGSVSYGGGTPNTPPDGTTFSTHAAENGVSAMACPLNALVGVFLDDSQPDTSAAPDTLNFAPDGNVNGGTNYTTISPGLKQIFFIGDGVTTNGGVQQIVVPTGATRLFLGTADGCGWYNNTGIFSVRVQSSAGSVDPTPTPTPTPAGTPPLRIAASVTSTSNTNGHFAHIGDDLEYTLSFSNIGTSTAKNLRVVATVPTYIENQTNLVKQFVATDVSMSPGSTFVPESSAGARDAHIVWNAGNLDADFQQFVRFTVHVANKVRIQQQIALPNSYSVSSATSEPPGSITGYESGAPNIETQIEGPISLFVHPNNTTVAPGAQFSYSLTLKNLGSTTASHAVATFVQPEFTRFISATFSNTPPPPKKNKKKKKGPAPFVPTAKLVYVQGQSDPQIVMDIGPMSANQTVTITLTFQAQWADPAEVPKLSTSDYAAAFLTDAAYAQFLTNYNSAVTLPDNGGSPDFMAFISNLTNIIAASRQDSGQVDVPLQGSLANAPRLILSKQISNTPGNTGSTDGHAITNTVRPGSQVSFMFIAGNTGESEADDIYVQDRLPDYTTFVSAGMVKAVDLRAAPVAQPPKKKKKGKKPKPTPVPTIDVGTLRVVPDSDGHHIRLRGLKLPPHVLMALQYTVQVKSGSGAPPNDTLINADGKDSELSVSSIGSSSSPHTPVGFYGGGAIQVTGTIVLPEPRSRALIASPGVSDNVNATATQLNSIYNARPSALPLVDPNVPGNYIPGVQRYYVHFQNAGSVADANVHLDVPLPANTVFYRAAFVSLPANAASGQDGYLPGTVLTPASVPAGFGITTPSFLSNGAVSFTFNSLPAGYNGDVMIEVIISNSAIAEAGSLVGNGSLEITFADGNAAIADRADLTSAGPAPKIFGWGNGHSAKSQLTVTPIADAARVPQVGIAKFIDGPIYAGKEFQVKLVFFNYGDTEARHAQVVFPLPQNTTYISETHTVFGSSEFIIDNSSGTPQPGDALDLFVSAMPPHTASAITFTLKATGPVGSTIDDTRSYLACDYTGLYYNLATHDKIETLPLVLQSPQPTIEVTVAGHPINQFLFNGGDVFVIDLGGGKIVAQGGGNIVAQGGGNIVAQGGGNIVAQGGGNLIPIGVTDGATLLANTAAIVAQGGGNIFVPQGSTIVAQGGGNIVASGAGNIVAQGGGNIVAQGGGNIVAQGGGNIVAQGGGNIFGAAAGQIVAQGGGNIVAQGGGNIVAQGGGNIVAQGGGNIVAQGAGNILASTPASSSIMSTPRSSIVAQGGGNIVAQGGGN